MVLGPPREGILNWGGGRVSLEQEANSREFKRKDSAEDGVGLTSA